jgi:diacylglycerol kinase family enzyme
MRALVVLNPRSGSLAKLGIEKARHEIAARCEANNLDATIAAVPGTGIADRIKGEIAAYREGSRPDFDTIVIGGGDGTVRAAASVLYMAKRGGRLALLRLVIRTFLSGLQPDRDFVLAQLKSVDISAHRRRLRVALDGESLMSRPPLHYRIRPCALRVIVPGPALS